MIRRNVKDSVTYNRPEKERSPGRKQPLSREFLAAIYLGAALAFIREQQLRRDPEHRSDRARAVAISTTLVCLKSAERFYEPGVLAPARYTTGAVQAPCRGRRSGDAERRGLRARPPPDPAG
jgi:hypothetical protein